MPAFREWPIPTILPAKEYDMARATKRDITAFQNYVESKISSTAIAELKKQADELSERFSRLKSDYAEVEKLVTEKIRELKALTK